MTENDEYEMEILTTLYKQIMKHVMNKSFSSKKYR